MNWETLEMRSSALSCLFTEPQAKAAKEAGELSQTAKSYLVKTYIQELWGIRKEVITKHMDKGIYVEDDAIALISRFDGKEYTKNQERKSNGWITGHADIIFDDYVVDVKASWDAESFIPKLIEAVDKCYYYQLQAYMWLWELDKAQLSYCLVSTPAHIIENERKRLLYSMDVISDESSEYVLAEKELLNSMVFDHIDYRQRVISHTFGRDEEIIKQIPAKVEKAREYLDFLQRKHQLYSLIN